MKKLYFVLGIGAMIIASSCRDTLDTHPTDFFDENTVFGTYNTCNAFVNATYESVINGLWAGNSTAIFWENRTPNSVYADEAGVVDDFTLETGISPANDWGVVRPTRVRKCNLIIEKAMASETLKPNEKDIFVGEGKFLRGLIFFDAARKMGRILPIKQVLSAEDTVVAMGIKMTSSLKECYDVVIDDFEDAAAKLPTTSSTGRANKYAAEVMLSTACLQAYAYTGDKSYLDKCIAAASDVVANKSLTTNYGGMFSDVDPYNPEILLGYYLLKENFKISTSEEAFKTLPNLPPDDQNNSCSNVFNNKNGKTFGGWCHQCPTQELVDQYLVIDDKTGEALPWYETSQWKENVDELDPTTITSVGQIDSYTRLTGESRNMPTRGDLSKVNQRYPNFTRYAKLKTVRPDTRNISELMYQHRDARFHENLLTDGDTYLGEHFEMTLDGNANCGVREKEDGGYCTTCTNYFWKKNTLSKIERYYYSVYVDYHYVIARVGDAYMNLAEAYLCKEDVANAVKALNATRVTHGKLPESKASTLEQAWKDYIRERNCEMCYEHGDLYFSYLRWGKYGGYANEGRPAGDVIAALDAPVHKIEISRDRSTILVGQVTLVNAAQRVFTVKRYLLPINQSFLDIREAYGLDHQQNEGW